MAEQLASIIGPSYKRYVPVIGTLALFILVSNLMGLIPGMLPPTDNLNTTFACSLIVFLYFNFHGLRVHGIGHGGDPGGRDCDQLGFRGEENAVGVDWSERSAHARGGHGGECIRLGCEHEGPARPG
jgi:hypothetical protein